MAERRVRATGKDRDGDITKLCHHGEPWSPRYKDEAIRDIEQGLHSYYVDECNHKTRVIVVARNGRKYLKTEPDGYPQNNLDYLPNC